ncbi:MAG: hypothetical protein ACTSWX_09395 [Promethearchaeota archaeon]
MNKMKEENPQKIELIPLKSIMNLTIIFSLLIILVIYILNFPMNMEKYWRNIISYLVVSIFLLVLGIFYYFKYVNVIQFTQNDITILSKFLKRKIYWKNITEITLTYKSKSNQNNFIMNSGLLSLSLFFFFKFTCNIELNLIEEKISHEYQLKGVNFSSLNSLFLFLKNSKNFHGNRITTRNDTNNRKSIWQFSCCSNKYKHNPDLLIKDQDGNNWSNKYSIKFRFSIFLAIFTLIDIFLLLLMGVIDSKSVYLYGILYLIIGMYILSLIFLFISPEFQQEKKILIIPK